MASLISRTLFLDRISTSRLLVILLLAIMTTATSAFFEDQEPNWVTAEDYSSRLRMFRGESLAAMSLASNGSELFLGAKNAFHIMNLRQTFADDSSVETVDWSSSSSAVASCTMKGKQDQECHNFIQIVLRNDESKELLVCGTNAWAPMCRTFEVGSYTEYQTFSGTQRCPFSPMQRSTALFADGALYSATVKSFTAVDSVILRSIKEPSMASKEVDADWLKVPAFINSFDVGDLVIFFFREIAVENSGEVIYSRVAKVCKSDRGGSWVLENTWTTFQKARLNCSFPGSFPFYFNYLQDVYMVGEGENVTFYGVFATGDHEIPGSAVCEFSLKRIKEIFDNGKFKEKKEGSRTYYPVPDNLVPDIRPGNCSIDSKLLPGPTLNFIAEHPLMDMAVPNLGDDKPRFDVTRADYRLVQVVVHRQKGTNNKMYDVLFLGTDDGRVMKVVILKDNDGQYRSNLLEEIYIAPASEPEAIVNMVLIRNNEDKEMVLVNTDSKVIELPLQRCSNLSLCTCVQDPYCVLNNLSDMCVPYNGNNFDSQNVENIQDCPKEVLPSTKPCTVPVPQTTTPVECLCPTAPPWVSTGKDCEGENPDIVDLTTSLVTTPTVATATETRTTRPITTPSKDPSLEPITSTAESTSHRTLTTTISNEIPQGKTTVRRKSTTEESNVVDPYAVGGSVGKLEGDIPPYLYVLTVIGWLAAIILLVMLVRCYLSKTSKGNYQLTDKEDPASGSYKPSPNKSENPENGKPPLLTSMQESPVKTNGRLPQAQPLTSSTPTPAYNEPKRNSYQPPNGAFSYMSPGSRQPPTGGVAPLVGLPVRIPSESDSRPSASGASDTELCFEDSDIWLKRPDGTEFGLEDEV